MPPTQPVDSPLTAWMVSCLSILPQKTLKVHQASHGARPHVATDRTARWLTKKPGTRVRIAQLFLGHLVHAPLDQLRDVVVAAADCFLQTNCHCDVLKTEFRVKCGEQQHHIVFWHSQQWALLLTDPTPCTKCTQLHAPYRGTTAVQSGGVSKIGQTCRKDNMPGDA